MEETPASEEIDEEYVEEQPPIEPWRNKSTIDEADEGEGAKGFFAPDVNEDDVEETYFPSDLQTPMNQDDEELLNNDPRDSFKEDVIIEKSQVEFKTPVKERSKISIPAADVLHETFVAPKVSTFPTRKICQICTGDVIYKAAARVVQDSTIPLGLRSCQPTKPGASLRGSKGGSNRDVEEMLSHNLQAYRSACKQEWNPNPTCTVPMRVKRYGKQSGEKIAKTVQEWKIWEERDKERRDHELAKKLGYETLVGNILYIDIPNGRDINRSWQNFLSEDDMEWGFPYEKGSIERPRMKQPDPYLAHQVQEILWKYPRARTFQITQEE